MKKILITCAVVFGSYALASAQPPSATSANNIKVMSVQDANKLNGVAQPVIDGKPYSQYKAEQDALKQKNSNQVAPAVFPEIKGGFAKGNGNAVTGAEKPEDKTRQDLSKVQNKEVKPEAASVLPAQVKPEAAPALPVEEKSGTAPKKE